MFCTATAKTRNSTLSVQLNKVLTVNCATPELVQRLCDLNELLHSVAHCVSSDPTFAFQPAVVALTDGVVELLDSAATNASKRTVTSPVIASTWDADSGGMDDDDMFCYNWAIH